MKIIPMSDVNWIFKPEAGVMVGRSSLLPSNESADVVYAQLDPGATLYRHYHIRPTSDGYIACFLFRGGDIEILREGSERERLRFNEPVHIVFFDREVHGIRNMADEPLLFEVVCAPRFSEGEEVLVEPSEALC